jgi:hypothetical protein
MFKHCFELRRTLYGLSEIIRADPSTAPPIFSNELQQVITSIVFLLEKHVARKEKDMREDESDNEKEEDIKSGDYKAILTQLQGIKSFGGLISEVEDDEEDEEGCFDDKMWAIGDLQLYDSPLEHADPVLHFRDVLTELETTNKPAYDRVVSHLEPDKIQRL